MDTKYQKILDKHTQKLLEVGNADVFTERLKYLFLDLGKAGFQQKHLTEETINEIVEKTKGKSLWSNINSKKLCR